MISLKIFFLAIVFVATSGAVFTNIFKNNKILSFFAAIVAVLGSWYLFNDLYNDLLTAKKDTPSKIEQPNIPLQSKATGAKKIIGKHNFSLQWISWDYFGTVSIEDRQGKIYLSGEQRSKQNTDYVSINGSIKSFTKNGFIFNGDIVTKVNFINNGNPCRRSGEMEFTATGNRKYWRLQNMLNPCTNIQTDYVDIFF